MNCDKETILPLQFGHDGAVVKEEQRSCQFSRLGPLIFQKVSFNLAFTQAIKNISTEDV